MDVLAVEKAARAAAESVRSGGGPHFLELRTYRYRAHSMFDPELYRSKDEVESWKHRDPIESFRDRLLADRVLTDDAWSMMEKEVAEEIDVAVEFAEAGSWEAVDDLTRFVYSEVSGT